MKLRPQNSLSLASRSSSLLGFCIISFCVFSAGHALAQATWDGGGTADGFGNYNWADGPNWLADSAPVSGNSLTFGGTANTTTSFNNIAADTPFAGITFDNTAGAFTLSGNRVTLGGNVVNNDGDLQTLNLDLLMSVTRTFDTASGNISVGGIVSGTSSAGLTKIGASTLTLANVNTYTGDTLVQNGILILRGGADNRLATTSKVSLGIGVPGVGTSGILQLGDSAGASNQTLTSLTRTGTTTANAVVGGHTSISTLTINSNTSFTFDGALGGGGTGQNNLALTKTGTGTLTLSATGSYTGPTHIQNGAVAVVAGDNRIGPTSAVTLGDSTANTSGILVIGNTGSARSQTVSSLTTVGTGTENRVVGAHGSNNSTLTVNNSAPVIYNGFVGGSGTNQNKLNLSKSGSGTLVLTQASSYVGNTTINAGGVLRAGNNSAFGITGTVTLTGTGAILELADGITINRGLTAAAAGDNKIIQLQDGATSGEYSGAIVITENLSTDFDLQAFAGGTLTVSGQIGASAGANINKEGAGTVVVSGNNTLFDKSVSINAGVLRAGHSNAFGSTGGITLANTGTGLELANGVTINRGLTINQLGDKKTLALQNGATAAEYSGTIFIKESTHGNVEVSVGDAGTLTISGAVSSEQPAGLTKTGLGTLILSSATNTYLGNTTISGGKLIVSGNISTSSLTTVAVDATLEGTGTVGKSVINGTLAIGNSVGQMNFTDTLGLNGSVVMEIDGTAGAGVAGGHDFANVNAALTYGGALTLDLGSILGIGTYSWNLFDFAGPDLGTFATITLADQYSGSLLDGDASGIWDLASGSNTWQFTESTGTLGLTVIPEPAAALLAGLSLLTLLRRRRA